MAKGRRKKELLSGEPTVSQALKTAGVIVGVGLACGTALVLVMNKVMKDIFVNEEWPEEEWSSNDWAQEELD